MAASSGGYTFCITPVKALLRIHALKVEEMAITSGPVLRAIGLQHQALR
jgi:hypothetical protein